MPNWKHIVRQRLVVLRLSPERESDIVEELGSTSKRFMTTRGLKVCLKQKPKRAAQSSSTKPSPVVIGRDKTRSANEFKWAAAKARTTRRP